MVWVNRCVALASWLVYRHREPTHDKNKRLVTGHTILNYWINGLAAAMRGAEQKGSAPHDLDSDGTQVAGIKGLLQGTHLIQHTPDSPHICLAIIRLALHSTTVNNDDNIKTTAICFGVCNNNKGNVIKKC